MDDIAGKIQLYHSLYLGCLCLAFLCLILAVVLFFVLDIRSVLGYLTGRQAKKKIRELEAANAVSGRLSARERSAMQYVAQDMKTDMGVRQKAAPGARKVENVVEESSPPREVSAEEPLPAAPMSPAMAPKITENAQETSLQQGDTELIANGSTAVLESSSVPRGRFSVERELILIHTEEVI